ncbi:MAG: Piwi domain protein [Flavobacterium sp.]|nr:MAG: Piwi domain protein [Flavobacterium sp.]
MFSNIFPLEIDFEKFSIQRVPYTEETLKSLRQNYNATHSFFRQHDHIYISNKSGEDLNIGSSYEFDVFKEREITLSLIRHVFFKTFLERFKNKVPLDFHPFRILSTREADDWVYDMLPENLKNRIGYKKLVELQFKYLEPNGEARFSVIANIERRWIFNFTCKDLLSMGFDPTGHEVLHSEVIPGLQNILAPNEEFVGTITSITNSVASVETASGQELINLEELALRRTSYNIKSFLAKTSGEKFAEDIFARIKREKRENLKHKRVWDELKKVIDSFCYTIPKLRDEKILYHNKDGFAFTIEGSPITFSSTFELKSPTFVFDKAGVKINNTAPDLGLSNYGPYDSNVFHLKSPSILSICHKNNRGRFTNFLKNLFDGTPESKYFKKGLKGKFELHNIQQEVCEVSNYTIEEYTKTLAKLDIAKPDVVIIELDDKVKIDDPLLYYRIKALMLTREIPVQVVLKSKIDGFNEYILNSIALQLYAKLGGVPWVLKSSMSVDREIVIGIGHSTVRKNTFAGAEQDRVVGITTFFSSDGQYLLSNKVKDVNYDEYFDELLKSLRESFNLLQTSNNWKSGDTIRLIFHIFKPIKNIEFDVVATLIKDYPNFKIQFAFVTIGSHHPFLMFDEYGGKVSYKYNNESRIGEFVPNRGSNFRIDKFSCLIQMLGGKEVKSDFHGASNPLLIKIRIPTGEENYREVEPLLFTDLQYIVQQIYSFTHLSWRNYLPSEHPATMLYSELIAKQLGRLRKIEGWSPDILNFSLKTKKWFL